MTSTTLRTFSTMAEIERTHSGHWFDSDTMWFFASRLPEPYSTPIGGRYFITSERRPDSNEPRMFTIREALSNGTIATIGEFQGYTTRRAAERDAAELPTTYSAYLMRVLDESEWIKTSKQLAKYTSAPLADAQATIKARAALRRKARVSR